ncbi:DUF6603 domain-containing protein [Undibacterium sp. Ji83W]|uniref:DUF6603 domain-containing protein n=1 Tax=Undibacterium sp. Ji83W TaxID=3413043 RepID=UPI003BF1FE0D
MISSSELSPSTQAVGQLIGLLRKQADGFELNSEWFSNPVSEMEKMGTRLDQVVDLLHGVLGVAASEPPSVFEGASWRMIQNTYTAGQSPYYVVLPPKGVTQGTIGVGTIQSIPDKGGLQVEAYVYLPLFSFSPSGAHFLLDKSDEALQLGLHLTGPRDTRFQSGAVSFSGAQLDTKIFLHATAPTMQLRFLGLDGTQAPNTYTSIQTILNDHPEVQTWLTAILDQSSDWLIEPIGLTPLKVGSLLHAVGLVKSTGNPPKYSLTLNVSKKPEAIALDCIAYLCTTILDGGYCRAIVTLPGGGIFISTRYNSDDGSVDYGIQVRMEMGLNRGRGTSGNAPGLDINLCLGAWLSGELDGGNNWMRRSLPPEASLPLEGLTLWLMSKTNDEYRFTPGFSLSSIGVDIKGRAGNPLVNIDGYSLQGVELRATLDALVITEPSTWTYGFAVKLYELGVPLLPSAGGGSGSNPVAQSLLQAGGTKQTAQGNNNPVNPSFGVAAAWYLHGTFDVQLYDQNDDPAEKVFIPISRTLGPLECERLGIGWVKEKSQLSVLFDGGVRVGELSAMLTGLTVGMPLRTPADLRKYELDLSGMGITFKAGPVSLDAAFVKIPPALPERPCTEYGGTATIEVGSFAISALGSYAYLPGQGGQDGSASIFIYGVMLAPLGGPEFFFVTGLAAGFGYNRAIKLPALSGVSSFPFVAALKDPAELGATQSPSGAWTFPNPAVVLEKIDDVVPPQRGEYWLAAGIRFTSFDLIHSSALVSVEFGNELQIALLGDSWMSMPPPSGPEGKPPSTRFAYVEMGVEIEILPSQGIISAAAVLTNNSFVIDPNCHLTGGFAFYVWFGDHPHAGEFVLAIGGYHPHFKPPTYYPQVPRLGFNWPITTELTISGDAYFALTPSCIMAGGGLQIVFSSGNLRAWFIAHMDALISWAPFHYNLDIGVSIGISYRLNLLFVTVTLKFELGASLTLWGPGMGGVVRINLYIISFSIGFGADESSLPPSIPWTDQSNGQGFAQTLLPQSTPYGSAPKLMTHDVSTSTPSASVLTLTAVSGLVSTLTDKDGNSVWLVSPANFSFSAVSSIPLTEMDVTPVDGETAQTKWQASALCPNGGQYFVCIRPMRATLGSSVLTLTLTDDKAKKPSNLAADFDFQPNIVRTQAAKWGKPLPLKPGGKSANAPEMNETLEGRLFGFQRITPKVPILTPSGDMALSIDITQAFTPDVVDDESPYYTPAHLPLNTTTLPSGQVPQENTNTWDAIKESLTNTKITISRTNIYNALIEQFQYDPQTNGDYTYFAKDPGRWLNGQPLVLPATHPVGNGVAQ